MSDSIFMCDLQYDSVLRDVPVVVKPVFEDLGYPVEIDNLEGY